MRERGQTSNHRNIPKGDSTIAHNQRTLVGLSGEQIDKGPTSKSKTPFKCVPETGTKEKGSTNKKDST